MNNVYVEVFVVLRLVSLNCGFDLWEFSWQSGGWISGNHQEEESQEKMMKW